MKKTIINVLISNFTSAGLGFILNIMLARLLSLEDYGKISLLLVIIIVIFTLFEFGFTNATVIFYNKFKDTHDDIETRLNYLYQRYLLFSFIPMIFVAFLFKTYYSFSATETIIIIVNVFAFSIYRYILSIFQAKADWKIYNVLNIANNIIKLLTISIFFLIASLIYEDTNFYDTTLFAYGVSALMLLILTILLTKKYSVIRKAKLSNNFINDFKKILIPIGISNILITITMRADVFFIEEYFGAEKVGVYVAANTLALVFPLITKSLMNVFLQKSARSKSDFLIKILQNQKKFLPYLILILVVSLIFTKPLFLLFFGDKYIESIDIFRVLLFAYIGGIFFTPLESYFYSHNQKLIMNIRFLQMLIVIIGLWIVVQALPLIAVPIVIVLSRVIGWGILYLNVTREVSC